MFTTLNITITNLFGWLKFFIMGIVTIERTCILNYFGLPMSGFNL